MIFNFYRTHRLIKRAIGDFKLSLQGLTVLTEAASGYYVLTPLIAALGGAKKVYALTKDSPYGKASDIYVATMELADLWGVGDRVEVIASRDADKIGKADIITNLGHVRPIDREFIGVLKNTAVISFMFEAWEFRPDDLDLSECRRSGIPVLATNESHPSLKIFNYVGLLALKLLFEAHVEIYRSNIIVIGGGKFGDEVERSLKATGAEVNRFTVDEGAFSSEKVLDAMNECDAVVLVEHRYRKTIIGPDGLISTQSLKDLRPGLTLIHIAGQVDQRELDLHGIPYHPGKPASAGYMSVTTDYVGPRPLIDLHTAGLKIGEAMARERLAGHDCSHAERMAMRLPIAQAITGISYEQ